MSNTFSAVENQIKIFKEMQDEIAKDTSILADEERRELEGYVDNQRRQCELYLKLKPVKKDPEPKAAAEKTEKKSKRSKKAEAEPAAAKEPAKAAEEKLGQDLFGEEPEKQATEIDIDDLLG